MNRRHALQAATAALLATTAGAWGQAGKAAGRSGVVVVQIVDVSAAQQDVSRDFLIGSRAAWQDINSKGGLRGRPVRHLTLEVDGSPDSLRQALATLRDTPSCVALSGSAGDPVAMQLVGALRQEKLGLAHAAPWLQNSSVAVDDDTFPIFSGRQEQISHALRSLSLVGVQEIGAIYASAADHALYHADLERSATTLKLRLVTFKSQGDLSRLGQQLGASTPPLLLFIGGTPELVQFTQGLERQTRQRYVVTLADVNLQTLMQLGGTRSTSVINTQPVPMVTAGLPVVRDYRATLARLFDEPPTQLSLAGYIAARYTFSVLDGIDGALTRASALAAFRQRDAMDLGGFRVSFDAQRRSANFVTQTLLTSEGRVIG